MATRKWICNDICGSPHSSSLPRRRNSLTPPAAQPGCGKTIMELESCNKAMADTYLPPHRVRWADLTQDNDTILFLNLLLKLGSAYCCHQGYQCLQVYISCLALSWPQTALAGFIHSSNPKTFCGNLKNKIPLDNSPPPHWVPFWPPAASTDSSVLEWGRPANDFY